MAAPARRAACEYGLLKVLLAVLPTCCHGGRSLPVWLHFSELHAACAGGVVRRGRGRFVLLA